MDADEISKEAHQGSSLAAEASSLYPALTTLVYGEDTGRVIPCFLDTPALSRLTTPGDYGIFLIKEHIYRGRPGNGTVFTC